MLTGFGPFGDFKINPSGVLAAQWGGSYEVLPVTFAAADCFVAEFRGDRVLMLGVAANRRVLSLEQVAHNRIGGTADVSGRRPDRVVAQGGPTSLPQTFWSPAQLARLADGPDTELSEDAGDYLCNYLFYAMRWRRPEVAAAFLHVPPFEAVAEARQIEIIRQLAVSP
jgi:pyroglutamyl-peptidase